MNRPRTDSASESRKRSSLGSQMSRRTTKTFKLRRTYSETLRQASQNGPEIQRFIIRPDNRLATIWDLYIFLLVCYVSIFTPVRISYFSNIEPGSLIFVLDLVVDFVFLLDIVKRFHTGFYEDSFSTEVQLDPVVIRWTYLKGWFIVDVISILPIDLIVLAISSGQESGTFRVTRLFKLLRLLRLAKLLKLLRLLRMGKVFDTLEEKFEMNRGVREALVLSINVLVVSHLTACGWYFLVTLEDNPRATWVFEYFGNDPTVGTSDLYVASLYWAVSTLTSVGFGDIVAFSTLERVYAVVVSFLGATLFGYIIGHMSSLVSALNRSSSAFNEKMDEIDAYLRHRSVPQPLAIKIRKYFKYYITRKSLFDEKQILDDLSSYLRRELTKFLVQDTVRAVHLFNGIDDPVFLSSICTTLRPLSAAAEDIIFQEGAPAGEMFFLVSGAVEIIGGDDGFVFETRGSGQSFGELDSLDPSVKEKRAVSARAVTPCEMFTLSKKDLKRVLDDNPEFSRAIARVAREKDGVIANLSQNYKLRQLVIRNDRLADVDKTLSSMQKSRRSTVGDVVREAMARSSVEGDSSEDTPLQLSTLLEKQQKLDELLDSMFEGLAPKDAAQSVGGDRDIKTQ